MVNLPGLQIPLPPEIAFLASPLIDFFLNLLLWLLIAAATNFILQRILRPLARRVPGELEDILLGILRRPVVILIVACGINLSLAFLPLASESVNIIRLIFNTLVTVVIAHIMGRIIRDVLIYYGDKWARRSQSRVDDVLVPIINLFGPVIIIIAVAFIILPMWGADISSILVGAGVVGLVLGLAFQDNLSNIFSGIGLLVEAPFRTGDLINLPDGRICEIERIGIRSTQMYSVSEHATIYVPNKILASEILTNITKPTLDQKYALDITIKPDIDLAAVQETLRRIAEAHPAVLVYDMSEKIPLLRAKIARLRSRAESLTPENSARSRLLEEADRNERTIPRLELEGQLNCEIAKLIETLRKLIRDLRVREDHGLNETERKEIGSNFLALLDQQVEIISGLVKKWTEAEDAWLNPSEYWHLRRTWDVRNEQFQLQWQRVRKAINHPDDEQELRLDDLATQMIQWVKHEYKSVPPVWKNPTVSLKAFDGAFTRLQLWFYVDNVRLEHDERPRRVFSEIAIHARETLMEMGAWG